MCEEKAAVEIRRNHIHIQLRNKINIFIGALALFNNRARSARRCIQTGIVREPKSFSSGIESNKLEPSPAPRSLLEDSCRRSNSVSSADADERREIESVLLCITQAADIINFPDAFLQFASHHLGFA